LSRRIVAIGNRVPSRVPKRLDARSPNIVQTQQESMPARYLLNGKEMSLTEIVKLAQRCGYRGPIRVVSSQMKAVLKKQGYELTKK
jgi:hypothetical protein